MSTRSWREVKATTELREALNVVDPNYYGGKMMLHSGVEAVQRALAVLAGPEEEPVTIDDAQAACRAIREDCGMGLHGAPGDGDIFFERQISVPHRRRLNAELNTIEKALRQALLTDEDFI